MRQAVIHGGGAAALCCAQLLSRKGWRVVLRAPAPAPAPTLVLNAFTVELINRVFDSPDDIFAGAHRLARRIAYWGQAEADPGADSACVVIQGGVLHERLLAVLRKTGAAKIAPASAPAREQALGWNVYAGIAGGRDAGPVPQPSEFRRFGRRHAVLAEVRLRPPADEQTCWIETNASGWLFLAPTGAGRATLQAVFPAPPSEPGAALSVALRGTRRIAALVSPATGAARVFAAAPGLMKPLCGPGWVAAGSRACAYDPLCGDGTGAAIREAILAAAALDGIERGLPRQQCLEHYRGRLTRALYAHLRGCHSFYSTAGFDDSWRVEMGALEEGLRELGREINSQGELRYGLRGLELMPLSHDATSSEPARL